MNRKKLLTWVWVVVLVAVGVVSGLIVSSRLGIMNLSRAQKEKAFKVSPALVQMSDALADVAAQVTPTVVNISTTKTVKEENPMYPFFEDPFFRKFFGEPNEPGGKEYKYKERSLGSGVIVSSDGYIITNNHVVEGANEIRVVLADKREFRAKVVGADSRSDVAVIKIPAKDLPAITWGNSDKLRPGEMVIAVGSPFGLTQSVTMGIISAVGRANVGIEDYEDFIQTDAAINPGNSGGAMIDLHGNLVGINTAILSGGGGNEGIGFAIPVNMARNVMDQIVEHGKVIRGYLGVTIQDVDPGMAKAFGLGQGGGALVSDVGPDSPAAKAGVQRGDIILKLNGNEVAGRNDLSLRIAEMAPGTVAHLQIYRNGKTQELNVAVGEFPEKAAAGQPSPGGGGAAIGLHVQNLTADLAQQLGLPAGTAGVVVTDVDPSSAAAEAGIQRGDVIQEVNRRPVRDEEQYRQALAGAGNQPVLLLVNRKGTTIYLVIEPQG